MMFVNDEGWRQFVSNMVGPLEDTPSSLCINYTAVMKRVNMKKGDMILEMGRCLKNILKNVYRRQILTTKVDPSAVRVNNMFMASDTYSLLVMLVQFF